MNQCSWNLETKEFLESRLEEMKIEKFHDSRRTVRQLLSALHRMVSPILWPSRTRCIFSSLSATRPGLQTTTADEATRLEVPNKNGRHVKFGGQVPPTVIGQSQAAMAAWHDFLGQSSRIYRALHRGPGRRIWRLSCRGGLAPNCNLPAPPFLVTRQRACGSRSAVFSHFCL